jgi:hypothetical protein
MSLQPVIDKLELFTDVISIPEIISDLNDLEALDVIADKSVVESLRTRLKELLSVDTTIGTTSLADTAYDTLLALACLSPLNTEDPITLAEIPPEDVVYASTGHQFSISVLVHYHNMRPYREELGETASQKWLFNPLANVTFSARDIEHIEAVATEKGIAIEVQNMVVSLNLGEIDFGERMAAELLAIFEALPTAITSLDLSQNRLLGVTAADLVAVFARIPSEVRPDVAGLGFFAGGGAAAGAVGGPAAADAPHP